MTRRIPAVARTRQATRRKERRARGPQLRPGPDSGSTAGRALPSATRSRGAARPGGAEKPIQPQGGPASQRNAGRARPGREAAPMTLAGTAPGPRSPIGILTRPHAGSPRLSSAIPNATTATAAGQSGREPPIPMATVWSAVGRPMSGVGAARPGPTRLPGRPSPGTGRGAEWAMSRRPRLASATGSGPAGRRRVRSGSAAGAGPQPPMEDPRLPAESCARRRRAAGRP